MNLIDYIRINGVYSFYDLPFNDVDNAILCQVSYVLFENIINKDDVYTIADLSELYFSKYSEDDIKKDKSFIGKSPLVLREMASSIRYRNIKMHDFICSSSKFHTHQFAAMQFDLSDNTTYVAFRGTDDSILGWEEDFQMAYKKIAGYYHAKKYINRHCSLFKKYRVGGHSKGGALAIYASCNCFSLKRKNIIKVYSNDGPGIKNEFINNKMELIKDRYIKIVPKNDIIGLVFDDDYEHKIIESNEKGIMQHDMLSWQIKNGNFITCRSLEHYSRKLKRNLNNYINNVSKKDAIKLGDYLFAFLDEIDIIKVSDLFDLKINDIGKVLKRITSIDIDSKTMIFNIVGVFLESNLPSISFSNAKIKKKKGRK